MSTPNTPSTAEGLPTAADYLDKEFTRVVRQVARELRALADDLDGRAEVSPSRDGKRDHTAALTLMMSRITNTLPNLALGQLVQAAHGADLAERGL